MAELGVFGFDTNPDYLQDGFGVDRLRKRGENFNGLGDAKQNRRIDKLRRPGRDILEPPHQRDPNGGPKLLSLKLWENTA